MIIAVALAGGCTTLSAARPLEPGTHEFGVTLGGGMVEFGGAIVPLPMSLVQVRHGLPLLADRPVELHYGLNATGLAFGTVQAHVGGAWLVVEQDRARPALSVANRLYVATNAPVVSSRFAPALQVWALDQIELTASWEGAGQLLYISASQYLDFGLPQFLPSPAVGVIIDPGKSGGLSLQPELRWYAPTVAEDTRNVPWVGIANHGALGVSLSVSHSLRGGR